MQLHYCAERYPNHKYLLPSFFQPQDSSSVGWVKKPIHGREGSNVTIDDPVSNVHVKSEGEYGTDQFIYQQYVDIPVFNGYRPVIGSWLIDHESAGMGIRETNGYITNNTARFVPHLFSEQG